MTRRSLARATASAPALVVAWVLAWNLRELIRRPCQVEGCRYCAATRPPIRARLGAAVGGGGGAVVSELDFDAIKALTRAATDGPWDVHGYQGGVSFIPKIMGADADSILAADAEFIAAARADVPALVAEVERLQRELDAVYGARENVAGDAS